MDRAIQLELVAPGRYRVRFEGAEIGVWKDPECSAARYLVDNGLASREDTLCAYRGETPGMKGGVGWLADRTAREDDSRAPTFVKWKPFPMTRRHGQSPSVASEVS